MKTGGMGGTEFGGTGGSAATGGNVGPLPECHDDAECFLMSDCCTCSATGQDVKKFPPCDDIHCPTDRCTALGVGWDHNAMCRLGQCIVGADCDQNKAVCTMPPPVCGPGKTPMVKGGCWGECINAAECRYVNDCSKCTGENQVCVVRTLMEPEFHCATIPKACGEVLWEECLCEQFCSDLNFCSLSNKELRCDSI